MLQFGLDEHGHEVAHCYLSDLLEKRVMGMQGEFLGKFSDVVVKLSDRYPEIDGIVLTKGGSKSYFSIEEIDLAEFALARRPRVELERTRPLQPSEKHFFVRDILYDRQIVDVDGAKVERVNDIRLLFSGEKAFVAQMDVGFTGLARRLGFEKGLRWLAKVVDRPLRDELIDWKFVQPLEERFISPISISLRQEQLKELHAGELADIIEELDRDQRLTLVQSIGPEEAADALEETDLRIQTAILRDLETELAADILEEMEPAMAADVMDTLPEDTQLSILAAMEEEDRALIEILIHAREDSAASLMTVDFIACPEDYNVAQAMKVLKEYAGEVESITYVYCMEEESRLRGVVSVRNLILSEPTTPLTDIMNRRLVTLSLDDDWETVANQFLKLKFKALPVVDGDGHLLGLVTFFHSFDELLPYYHRLAA
jgi:magnesium transporter